LECNLFKKGRAIAIEEHKRAKNGNLFLTLLYASVTRSTPTGGNLSSELKHFHHRAHIPAFHITSSRVDGYAGTEDMYAFLIQRKFHQQQKLQILWRVTPWADLITIRIFHEKMVKFLSKKFNFQIFLRKNLPLRTFVYGVGSQWWQRACRSLTVLNTYSLGLSRHRWLGVGGRGWGDTSWVLLVFGSGVVWTFEPGEKGSSHSYGEILVVLARDHTQLAGALLLLFVRRAQTFGLIVGDRASPRRQRQRPHFGHGQVRRRLLGTHETGRRLPNAVRQVGNRHSAITTRKKRKSVKNCRLIFFLVLVGDLPCRLVGCFGDDAHGSQAALSNGRWLCGRAWLEPAWV
jgi:hypothetical protein